MFTAIEGQGQCKVLGDTIGDSVHISSSRTLPFLPFPDSTGPRDTQNVVRIIWDYGTQPLGLFAPSSLFVASLTYISTFVSPTKVFLSTNVSF